MRFQIKDMASYDDLGKVQKSAYVLEKGEYHFYVGTSVRDTVEDNFVMVLEEDVVTEQLSSKVAPSMLDKRMLSDGTYETLPSGEPVDTDANALGRMSIEQMDGFAPSGSAACRRTLLADGWYNPLLWGGGRGNLFHGRVYGAAF